MKQTGHKGKLVEALRFFYLQTLDSILIFKSGKYVYDKYIKSVPCPFKISYTEGRVEFTFSDLEKKCSVSAHIARHWAQVLTAYKYDSVKDDIINAGFPAPPDSPGIMADDSAFFIDINNRYYRFDRKTPVTQDVLTADGGRTLTYNELTLFQRTELSYLKSSGQCGCELCNYIRTKEEVREIENKGEFYKDDHSHRRKGRSKLDLCCEKFERAYFEYKNFEYEQALEFYNEAAGFLQNGYIYYYRGLAYLALGNKERALEDFNEAVRKKEHVWEAYFERGKINYFADNEKAALADFKVAHNLAPSLAAVLYRGNSYRYLDQDEKALSDLTEAVGLLDSNYRYSFDIDPYYWRAQVYKKLKMYNEAQADLSESYKLSCGDPDILREKADLHILQGEYTRALGLYDEKTDKYQDPAAEGYADFLQEKLNESLIDDLKAGETAGLLAEAVADPEGKLFYKCAGQALTGKDYETALFLCYQAVRQVKKLRDRSRELFYLAMGEAYQLSGNPQGAVTIYDILTEINPYSYRGYLEKASLYGDLGDFKTAAGMFEKASFIDKKKYHRKVIAYKVSCLIRWEKFREAEDELVKHAALLESVPGVLTDDHFELICTKAVLFEKQNLFSRAKQVYLDLLQEQLTEDRRIEAHLLYAACLYHSGKKRQALTECTSLLERASESKSNLPGIYYLLSRIYYEEGEYGKSLEAHTASCRIAQEGSRK